jgi:hypothetical protein
VGRGGLPGSPRKPPRAGLKQGPRFRSHPGEMLHGIHRALLVLGATTVLSAVVFRELKRGDGDNVSQHGEAVAGE